MVEPVAADRGEMAAAGLSEPPSPPTEVASAAPSEAETIRAAVWARVQLARNVRRPHTLELLKLVADDIVELHGDRLFGDDEALVGGLATLSGHRFVFVGHQKGADVEENIRRNFGMPHPEGYRKAMRLFGLAERFGLPVVTFVDTPGASPDAASEERGQAEAIARSIATMTALRTPIITVITGEGGSGGALAIAVGDVVLALENAVYSVISPEGCASILWRSPDAAHQAAVAMRVSAADQRALGIVDRVVAEPPDGAQMDAEETARLVADAIVAQLELLVGSDPDELVDARYARYRGIGAFTDVTPALPPRRERRRVSDRIRDMLGSGRSAMGVPESAPLRPQPVEVAEDPPLYEEI